MIVLVFSGLLLSVPPHNLIFYIILLVLAVFPLMTGARSYRIFGMVAVVLSLVLIGLEIKGGIRINRERQKRIQHFRTETENGTNGLSSTAQP
ncbi:MAG: hypothetical protein JWQ71_1608 [Pedosphaera sp.]|nr:hypothetical protein [Pedosphaera sp.]